MAVLPSLPGVKATVCVDKVPLQEYDDDDVEQTLGDEAHRLGPKTVSKYVEAVTDKEFTVELCVGRPYVGNSPTLRFDVYVDGHWAAGNIIDTPREMPAVPSIRSINGSLTYNKTTRQGTMHYFKFSSINTTSSEEKLSEIKEDAARMSKVGQIRVRVCRASKDTLKARADEAIKFGSTNTEVHEKALKGQAKSHGVSAGRTCNGDYSLASHVEFLDPSRSPIANFIFQYRSREALKSLCILERTPEPGEAVSPVSDIPNPRVRGVKRERDEGGRVKPEPQPKRSKYKMTIDLTVDSSDDDSIITLE